MDKKAEEQRTVLVAKLLCIKHGEIVKVTAIEYDKDSTIAEAFYADTDGMFGDKYKAGNIHIVSRLNDFIDKGTEIKIDEYYLLPMYSLLGNKSINHINREIEFQEKLYKAIEKINAEIENKNMS